MTATFSVIAAVALNGVIGDSKTNSIPWKLSADLKHFKKYTLGKTVIMGSTTFNSLKKPLKDRRNIVLTRSAFCFPDQSAKYPGADAFYHSVTAAMFCEKGEQVVIGGAHVYRDALQWQPFELCITIVDLEPEGDVLFPIAGRKFDAPALFIPLDYSDRSMVYNRTLDSGWQEENGIRFKFTTFAPRLP
jgi:dihydrofolate reductase